MCQAPKQQKVKIFLEAVTWLNPVRGDGGDLDQGEHRRGRKSRVPVNGIRQFHLAFAQDSRTVIADVGFRDATIARVRIHLALGEDLLDVATHQAIHAPVAPVRRALVERLVARDVGHVVEDCIKLQPLVYLGQAPLATGTQDQLFPELIRLLPILRLVSCGINPELIPKHVLLLF